jgi:hypothetical protein
MNMQTPPDDPRNSTGVLGILSRHQKLVVLLLVDIALFVIAELTYNNAQHPGTVSNIAWYAFLIGTASLVILVIVAIAPPRSHVTMTLTPSSRVANGTGRFSSIIVNSPVACSSPS